MYAFDRRHDLPHRFITRVSTTLRCPNRSDRSASSCAILGPVPRRPPLNRDRIGETVIWSASEHLIVERPIDSAKHGNLRLSVGSISVLLVCAAAIVYLLAKPPRLWRRQELPPNAHRMASRLRQRVAATAKPGEPHAARDGRGLTHGASSRGRTDRDAARPGRRVALPSRVEQSEARYARPTKRHYAEMLQPFVTGKLPLWTLAHMCASIGMMSLMRRGPKLVRNMFNDARRMGVAASNPFAFHAISPISQTAMDHGLLS